MGNMSIYFTFSKKHPLIKHFDNVQVFQILQEPVSLVVVYLNEYCFHCLKC